MGELRFGIVLAAYRPQRDFFEKQIASIRQQSHSDWVVYLQDDSCDAESSQMIASVLGEDDRFKHEINAHRLGVYHNFERGLLRVESSCTFVALSDQDDVWREDKLARLARELESNLLTHSDLRVIDASAQVLHTSCWELEQRHPEFLSDVFHLFRNVFTGCAMAFRRELLETALPFPQRGEEGHFLHDAWLGAIGLRCGQVSSVSEPLLDYRIHNNNLVGPGIGTKRNDEFRDVRGNASLWRGCLKWVTTCYWRWRPKFELNRALTSRLGPSGFAWFGGFPDGGLRMLLLALRSARVGYWDFSSGAQMALGKLRYDLMGPVRLIRRFRSLEGRGRKSGRLAASTEAGV